MNDFEKLLQNNDFFLKQPNNLAKKCTFTYYLLFPHPYMPHSNPPEHATYMQDCCLLTPLTPTTDYQQFSEELTHTNVRTNTHTNTHTKCRTNHSQNVSRQSRKFRGLSQKFHGLSEKSHGLSQMFHGRA